MQVVFDLLFGTGGNSNAKLKTMAIGFIHHLIDQCPEAQIGVIGPVLMSALRNLIEKSELLSQQQQQQQQQQQPEGEGQASAALETRQSAIDVTKLRASAYIAIGKLGRKLPKLVNSDISTMQTFFEAMSKEDKETQLSLQVVYPWMFSFFKQASRPILVQGLRQDLTEYFFS